MTAIASRIEVVPRGSWVNVASDRLYLERYGYENARNHELRDDEGGAVRIWDKFVTMQQLGGHVSVATYYMGRIRVSAIPLAAPLTDNRDRVLGVEVFHVGVTTNASNILGTLVQGAVDFLKLWPAIGQVQIPLIEPATTLPGQFVQYSVTRLIVGQTSSVGSVETETEASAFCQTFKVMFLGWAQ